MSADPPAAAAAEPPRRSPADLIRASAARIAVGDPLRQWRTRPQLVML